tara:strand:- start:68292 stop:68468 length:177 start_codon:yes stop_codon:yes gene_type:complete
MPKETTAMDVAMITWESLLDSVLKVFEEAARDRHNIRVIENNEVDDFCCGPRLLNYGV